MIKYDYTLKNFLESGNRHYKDRNYAGALECAERAIRKNPHDENGWLLKGIALREMGKLHEAVECFNEAIILDKLFYNAYIENCAAYLALDEYDKASKCVDEALTIHPRLSNALGWKGFVAYSSEQYHTAIAWYNKAISNEKGKKNAGLRSNLGDALVALERYDQALDYYATASDLDKKDAEPIISMASIILEIYANKDESDKKLTKALELDPNAVYVYWIDLGVSLLEEGKSEEALDYFDKTLASDSLFKSLTLINKGLFHFKQNDYVRSIDYFNSVIEGESNYSTIALICKSLALSKLNNFEEAGECYREANKLNDDFEIVLSKKIIYPNAVGNLIFFRGYDSNHLVSLIKDAEIIFKNHSIENPSNGPDDKSTNADKMAQGPFPETDQMGPSEEEFLRIQEIADENGSKGELSINEYLNDLKTQGLIQNFEWISKTNKFSTYDFCIIDSNNERVFLDVKTTNGEFNQRIFVSNAELKQMAYGEERYDIYRVYEINSQVAKLRISRDIRDFAEKILVVFEGLPEGVIPYNVLISPSSLQFDPEIDLREKIGK